MQMSFSHFPFNKLVIPTLEGYLWYIKIELGVKYENNVLGCGNG